MFIWWNNFFVKVLFPILFWWSLLLPKGVFASVSFFCMFVFVGNKVKVRISKQMFQENKARQIFRKTNICFPLICHFALLPASCLYHWWSMKIKWMSMVILWKFLWIFSLHWPEGLHYSWYHSFLHKLLDHLAFIWLYYPVSLESITWNVHNYQFLVIKKTFLRDTIYHGNYAHYNFLFLI